MSTFRDLSTEENQFIKDMFKNGDRDALKLYGYWAAAGALGNIYEEYSRIFGLCRLLGGLHIYDIGCGGNYQACLLYRRHEMTYTGIDAYEFFDYDQMNRMFSDSCGKRIQYLCAHYPCPLSILPGNAAIARRWQYPANHKPALKRFAEAISRDFERIITNFEIQGASREEMIRFWEEAMPGFHAVRLGDENLIFATRIPEDFEKMTAADYAYGNANFAIRPH
ncbi:MAG: hypothetical protein ACI4V1_02150 [Eubacteriales bacterium]